MKKRAAVDCGSNTTRLLIVDEQDNVLDRQLSYTKLGEGVDESGQLTPSALQRFEQALQLFRGQLEKHQVERLGVFATSAVRDASNQDEFVDVVKRVLKVEPRILSGEDEARLTYLGATSHLQPGEYALIDIGGGSTELGWRTDDSGDPHFVSIDVGAVRIAERCLRSDPHTETELVEAQGQISEAFGKVPHPIGSPALVAVAGTVTTIAALALGLEGYDRDKVHGTRLTKADIFKWSEILTRETVEQRIARGVPEGRASVIGAGALILDLACEVFGFHEVLVSEDDNLEGQVQLLEHV